MICHSPLAVNGQSASLNLEPVPSPHILDSAVISGEREELFPEFEAGQLWPDVVLAAWEHQQTLAMACNNRGGVTVSVSPLAQKYFFKHLHVSLTSFDHNNSIV